MRTFWFCDDDEGDFLVEANTLSEAKRTAKKYFDNPCLIEEVSEEEAEELGFDTY